MSNNIEFKNALIRSTSEIMETQKGKINAMLKPEFIKCNIDDESWEIRYPMEEWMQNRAGHLHGGLTATMFDFAFGCLIRNAVNIGFAPTVELSVSYFRPVVDCHYVTVKSKIVRRGKKISHVQGEMIIGNSDKVAAMGKGIFFNEDTR